METTRFNQINLDCQVMKEKLVIHIYEVPGSKLHAFSCFDVENSRIFLPTKGMLKNIFFECSKSVDEKSKTEISCSIPPNLMYFDFYNFNHFIWYSSPRKQVMYFQFGKTAARYEIKIPGFIYSVTGHGIKVYCFPGERPEEQKKILVAPVMNTNTDGNVCTGMQERIEISECSTIQEFTTKWENLFWLSPFTHGGHEGMFRAGVVKEHNCKDGEAFWKKILTKYKKLDTEWLRESHIPYQSLI